MFNVIKVIELFQPKDLLTSSYHCRLQS